MKEIPIYVIHSENGTYGAFLSESKAEKEKSDIYKNGFFGGLDVVEETLQLSDEEFTSLLNG